MSTKKSVTKARTPGEGNLEGPTVSEATLQEEGQQQETWREGRLEGHRWARQELGTWTWVWKQTGATSRSLAGTWTVKAVTSTARAAALQAKQ